MGVHISLEDDDFTGTLKGKSLYADMHFSHDISTPYTFMRSWFSGWRDFLNFNAPFNPLHPVSFNSHLGSDSIAFMFFIKLSQVFTETRHSVFCIILQT